MNPNPQQNNQTSNQGKNQNNFFETINNNLKKELINKNISELDIKSYIRPKGIADEIAKNTKIKRSQLRKFFNQVKELKNQISKYQSDTPIPQELSLKITTLLPKLAYAVGRNTIDRGFYEFMRILLEKLEQGKRKDFDAFEQIFEAIIAYHTYHHPTEG
ncbi:MAG: type III-A CRISPR-associated protein Csm2 [Leptospiraceae bacterium]|nr:MAG: type III-A CRISPR-associated protein Csm2 [Leptospiraceae bacterium]